MTPNVDFAGDEPKADAPDPNDANVLGASLSVLDAPPKANVLVNGVGVEVVVVIDDELPNDIELFDEPKENPPDGDGNADGAAGFSDSAAFSVGFEPNPPKLKPPFLFRELLKAGG